MAKKNTKKEDLVLTNTENIEEITQEIAQGINKENETELQETIEKMSEDVENTITEAINEINETTEFFQEETEKKDTFLDNMNEDLESKNEDELKDIIQEEIKRVDGVIEKVSTAVRENKIPLTTRYWNGMNYDI